MPCGICSEPIDDPAADDVVATSHFVPGGHHLWPYSDTAFHPECLRDWEHRAEFVALYEEKVGPWHQG